MYANRYDDSIGDRWNGVFSGNLPVGGRIDLRQGIPTSLRARDGGSDQIRTPIRSTNKNQGGSMLFGEYFCLVGGGMMIGIAASILAFASWRARSQAPGWPIGLALT